MVAAWHPGTRATSNVGNRIIAVVRSLWLSSTTRSRGGGVCKRTRWKCRLYVVGVLLAPSWFPPCLQTSRRQCRFRIGKKWPAILIGRNHIWSCMTRLGPRHIAVFRSRSDMAYIVLSIFQQGLRDSGSTSSLLMARSTPFRLEYLRSLDLDLDHWDCSRSSHISYSHTGQSRYPQIHRNWHYITSKPSSYAQRLTSIVTT